MDRFIRKYETEGARGCDNKALVFMLFGQSNAVGHAVPMKPEDVIAEPLKNVFGLSRERNQFFENEELYWSGYTSAGMNLGETQDDTYSLANCLAKQWQDAVDRGEALPDLYVIHIAIGAQGVTEQFMWYPERPEKLVPGPLGTADISLFPLACHVLSLVPDSMKKIGKTPEYVLHWRGGEEDELYSPDELRPKLRGIYDRMFEGFYAAAGVKFPVVIHKFCDEEDSGGNCPGWEAELETALYINTVFDGIAADNDNISLFDARTLPAYDRSKKYHGLFIDDGVHYTPDVNNQAAKKIIDFYLNR